MTECFDCLESPNYAAVARELQQTALQAEACIFVLERALRAVPNGPTQIRTSTANLDFSSGTTQDLRVATTTTTFSTLSISNFFLQPLPAGVYEFGAFVQTSAVGAVDANSYRYLYLSMRNQFDPPAVPDLYRATESAFEANNGTGMDMCALTTVALNGTQNVVPQFIHNNTSSQLRINIGAIYWVTRLSDQIALETV